MKQLLTLFTCLICFLITAIAQNPAQIRYAGTITDSITGNPLPQVLLTVNDQTGLLIQSLTGQEDGRFSFSLNRKRDKTYRLSLSLVGYQHKTIALALGDTAIVLGKITLVPAGAALQEVVVKASKPLVRQEIDRLVYDVQADPQSTTQTAMDMLRRVPLISVDGDDNIQLQGSGNFRIFINGKPSALVTNNPKDVLKSMPANLIQRIEVITTPPAKYEAEGLAGIINIITAKKTEEGYNATVTLRENWLYGPALNFSGTAKQDKFGISAYAGTGFRPRITVQQEFLRKTYGSTPDLLQQDGTNSNDGHYLFTGSEMSYELDSLHLLTGSLNYFSGRNSQDYNRFSNYTLVDGTALQSYQQVVDGGYNYSNIDCGLNYQLGFRRKKEQLLTASYRYSFSLNGQFSNSSAFNRFQYYQPDNKQYNDAGYNEHAFQLDYVHPVKKLTIEAGAKAVLRDNYSNSAAAILDPAMGYVNDAGRTNDFTYRQDIYSMYNSYSLKFTKWSFQAGLRAEFTRVTADFTSTATSLDMHYSNLVPSLSVLKVLSDNRTLTFGITNRLMRPYIQQLNPFVDKSNPQMISTGNPGLSPVISHLFELSYNRTGKLSLNTRLSFMYTNNSIEYVTRLIADTQSISSYDNVGKSRIARLNINGNINLNPDWNISFNTGVFYVWISGTYNGRFYSNQGPRTNTFVNTTYKLKKDWQLGFSGGYNRRYINLQGSSNDYYYINFTGSKTIGKFNFTAVLTNPFQRLYAFTQYSDTPDFYQSNTTNSLYRNLSLSVNYKFGKLNGAIKKNKRGITTDDNSGTNN